MVSCSELFRKLLVISFEKIIGKCDGILWLSSYNTQLFVVILTLVYWINPSFRLTYHTKLSSQLQLVKASAYSFILHMLETLVGFFRLPASPGISCRWTVSAALWVFIFQLALTWIRHLPPASGSPLDNWGCDLTHQKDNMLGKDEMEDALKCRAFLCQGRHMGLWSRVSKQPAQQLVFRDICVS